MQAIKAILLVGALSLGYGCGDDTASAAKPTASTEDVCVKAKRCSDALREAEPERAKVHANVWKGIASAAGDAKPKLCKQVLDGAAYNPNAPAACK